jgi:hypothetical protein
MYFPNIQLFHSVFFQLDWSFNGLHYVLFQFFQIDENSGVLSTKQTFDREQRDAYLIPIAIHRNGTTQPEVDNITVFIDDVDDNPPEKSPIKVFVFGEGSEFFGNIDQLYPPDEDSISSGACSIADDTSSLNVKVVDHIMAVNVYVFSLVNRVLGFLSLSPVEDII